MIPTLTTARLTLRPPSPADIEPYTEILASPRAAGLGGPFDAADAWYDFCAMAGSWALNSYGPLSIDDPQGVFAGLAILHHEYGDPEPELGCILTEAAQGNGYAFEAMVRMRDYAFDTLGWRHVASYVAPSNTRSIRMCERLGAQLDLGAPRPSQYPDCLVFRHTPGAAARIDE